MRPGARAIAGYYPTPTVLLPTIASAVSFPPPKGKSQRFLLFDPCAGEGEAILALRKLWWPEAGAKAAHILATEMEEERAALLSKSATRTDWTVHADAFSLTWPKGEEGCSLLFLNPPYDSDRRHGRLEERFLARFGPTLAPGGVLIYIVPGAGLVASAQTLGRLFTNHRAWRFPGEHFDAYRQCVLLARRAAMPLPGSRTAERIRDWGRDSAALPPLPPVCEEPLLVEQRDYGFSPRVAAFDYQGARAEFKPWAGVPALGTDLEVQDLIGRSFPTALPPKPAHLALALAAGHFNGHELWPDDDGFPPILLKGMFTRELIEVEEKVNKDGEVTGRILVQQPRLEMCALRLDTYEFFRPPTGAEPTGSEDVEQCNVADLLIRYSGSLAELMAKQFPSLHDPPDREQQIRLPDLGRPLFTCQHHAVQASLKLLASDRNPKMVSQVGTGKTGVALYIAAALNPRHHEDTCRELRRVGFTRRPPKVRRTLVICPPHLLMTWETEARAVWPSAWVKVVTDIADLRCMDAQIYLLSRETAKLGHGYRGVAGGHCPRCGAPFEESAEECVSRRLRCQAVPRLPANVWAEMAEDLAAHVLAVRPNEELAGALSRRHRILHERAERPPAAGINGEGFLAIALRLGALLPHQCTMADWQQYSKPIGAFVELGRGLAMESAFIALIDEMLATVSPGKQRSEYGWAHLLQARRSLAMDLTRGDDYPDRTLNLVNALSLLHELAAWRDGEVSYRFSRARRTDLKTGACNEPLWQAVPEPRRFPLATYICRRLPRMFDLLVLDEAHEAGNQGTAQEKAAHRLVELGLPTLMLSGSIMGGYASSLFANWWSLDRAFRESYDRSDRAAFVRRYGFLKFFESYDEKKSNNGRSYGSQSDRETNGLKPLGEVPGILPLFLLRHLLPAGIVMHQSDLESEIPPMHERSIAVPCEEGGNDAALLAEYRRLEEKMLERVRGDMFTKLAGKLWGAMGELPSYLDRCTDDQERFVLKYPEDVGGMIVAEGMAFPASWRTPKERWLLDRLRERLTEGRKVLVFLRHTQSALPLRLLRLIKAEVTPRAAFLAADRVLARKREQWINDHILAKGIEVMIVNPKAISTGLNNLVSFSAGIWYDTDYDARTYRQANGRLHRIGTVRDIDIDFAFFSGTAQEIALRLISRKVTSSLQVDGLSVQGALESFGSEGSERAAIEMALQLGEAIYRRLSRSV